MENRKSALPPVEDAVRALAARDRRALAEHPRPEELAAYHEGELAGAAEDRLREHLALCPDCAQLLLDLAGFADLAPPDGVRPLSDGDVDAAWQALRPRLDGETAGKVVRLPAPPRGRSRPSSWVWALAASWVAVAGLAFWVAELKRENAELARPTVKVAVRDLLATGDTTRGSGGERTPKPLPAGERLLLFLDAAGIPEQPGYAAEIVADRQGGPVVWSERELPRDRENNNFTLDLPPGFLRPGRYRVVLYGTGDGKRDKLADYPLPIGAS